MAFVFYDTETTGISTGFDQILQFAAVRTDDDLVETDRIEMRCRLHPHVVPHPGALCVTGMTIEQLIDEALPCHYDMVRAIRAKLAEWSPATFIGYNSMRFDEELLRKALFRTLHSPYLTNTGGNTRSDAMTLVQVASAFVPACVQIPYGDDGKASFKLDRVAPLNGFDHSNAHDALADVLATVHLAKCVKENAPEVWSRFLRFSSKAAAIRFLEENDAVVATEFYFNRPYHFVVTAIGSESGNPAAILAFDLKHDLDWVASLPQDELNKWVGKNPKKIRRIRTNAAPSLAGVNEVPEGLLGGFTPEEIHYRATRLKTDHELRARLIAAYSATAAEYEDSPYVEEQIYSGGFVSTSDQALMNRFHEVPWEERAALVDQMQDARLQYHGRLLIYEQGPHLLSEAQRTAVDSHIRERLLAPEAPKDTWTTLHAALAYTETMIQAGEAAKLDILHGLRAHLVTRINHGGSRVS